MKLRKLKKATKYLAARIKAWEQISDNDKKAFRKPGAMRP